MPTRIMSDDDDARRAGVLQQRPAWRRIICSSSSAAADVALRAAGAAGRAPRRRLSGRNRRHAHRHCTNCPLQLAGTAQGRVLISRKAAAQSYIQPASD